MRSFELLILALAAPLLCRCASNPILHEVGGTRMIFETPSLSRAETEGGSRLAFKAEAGGSYRGAYPATTDGFQGDGVDVKPAFPGNLRVAQGERSVLGSAAFRVTETGDVFVQAEAATVGGILASIWLAGYRTETDPEGFSAFLEAGAGLIDVYIGSTVEKYRRDGFLFPILEGDREYLGSETVDEHRFVPFPHLGGGLKVRFRPGLRLLAKARTLFVHDAFGLGTDAFLNSAGAEAELALSQWLSLHAAAELQANTLPDSRVAKTLGLGFTLRPW